MIYILEGPDGVGKTTLAQAIAEKTKGHVIHCSWNKDWNMKQYFETVFQAAYMLNEYQDVIIDRWAPSEHVYGNVFRGGPSFNVFDLIKEANTVTDVTWVMCKHPNAVENHKKHLLEREEMFSDMTKVVDEFEDFEYSTDYLEWIEYDYSKKSKEDWINEYVTRR